MTTKPKPTQADIPVCSGVEAMSIFDKITGASYYGVEFRWVLMNDPEAVAAARKLVARLQAAGVRGMDFAKEQA
jgi:hypothetical protein